MAGRRSGGAAQVTRTARTTRVLGPNGKPFSIGHLYPTPRNNPKAYKPRQWLSKDTKQNVCEYDRMELVDLSRQLVSQIDILATAIEQKNNWAFGDAWDAHYVGQEKQSVTGAYSFIGEAREFLEFQFYPYCNVRGPQFDLRESLKLMGKAWDRDGDDLMILTESEAHFPQLAFYPATRIGSWGDNGKRIQSRRTEVTDGAYDGATIFDGIILNRNNRPIAVRLLNDDGTHTDVSLYSADLGFEPQWCDQVRGIPRVATSLLRWLNLQDIDGFLQDGVKRASTMSFKTKRAEGEAGVGNQVLQIEDSPAALLDPNNIVGGGASERKLHFEEIAGGGSLIYLDSTQNEDIEAIDYSNPHPNVEAFIQRIQRGSLASVGWFYELLNLNEGGRAPSRMLCDLANQTITDRQATGRRRWKRIISYALAKASKHGFIRRPRDQRDFGLWEPGYPKHLSVDAGNDVKAGIEMCKFGLSTASIEAAKFGYHIDHIREQQEAELRGAIEMAKRLEPLVAGKGMAFQDILQLVRQNNPNPVSQPQQQQAGGGQSGGDKSSAVSINLSHGKRVTKIVRDERGAIVKTETEEA